MNADKQIQINKTNIELPCSIGDTVYVTKSYFDDDGYLVRAIAKTEVVKIRVVLDKTKEPSFEIDTRVNTYGPWLVDTFPDEESAKASLGLEHYQYEQ